MQGGHLMTDMTDLNLRHLVQEVTASATSVEWADIAADVLNRIDNDDLRAALAQALPAYIRYTAVSARAPGRVTPPSTVPGLPGSWKVQGIREGWQRRKEEIYATAEGHKRLGDFTYADLLYQSGICSRQAKQKLSKAKGWRDLADLMEAEGVATVRDLPAEMLMTTLGAVA